VFLRVEGDVVQEASFKGSGCSISTASASMMTDAVKGKTLAETQHLFERFHELVTADPSKAAAAGAELGKLAVFAGVHEFPMRVKCASLAWHTMKAALEGGSKATTE
jgi:nitrogen fixation protein NifU and related proteins